MIVVGLETPSAKTPGEVLRVTPAPQPALVGYMILGLTALIFLFAGLVFTAVYDGASLAHLDAAAKDPAIDDAPLGGLFVNEQVLVSFWLACLFFCLFFITLLYQRFYTDHVLIAKRRFRKWEDEGVQL